MRQERFKIVRYYAGHVKGTAPAPEVLMRGLSEAEARAHVRNPEANSTTATGLAAQARTQAHGAWNDAMVQE